LLSVLWFLRSGLSQAEATAAVAVAEATAAAVSAAAVAVAAAAGPVQQASRVNGPAVLCFAASPTLLGDWAQAQVRARAQARAYTTVTGQLRP